ncbi:TFIIB-type zinc ribbon-containing protein [Thermobifida cellulosilytica]|nr:zf-TFIIB domain-containing protein [Thermobifida cellulosilytica]
MICPKCQGRMRTFDRMGVHIDQCERCRGIFLDAGELEQIVAAEQRHYAPPPPPPPPHGAPPPPAYHHRPDSPAPYGYYADSPGPYGYKRRRKSFLEELFD